MRLIFLAFLFPILLFGSGSSNNVSVPIVSVIDQENSIQSSVNKRELCSPEEKPYRPPVLAASAIIEVYEGKNFKGIIVIDRWNAPLGKALPGGKVEYGETVEEAIAREMKEELSIHLRNLRQFHVYSSPSRDPRFHCVDVLFLAETDNLPKAGDDAAKSWIVSIEELSKMKLVFDHSEMVRDYLKYRNESNKGSLNHNILLPQKLK